MTRGKRVESSLKTEIVRKIRDAGLSVSVASAEYKISSKSIYIWLRDGIVDGSANLILENNRLKKENEQLYSLIGRAIAELKRTKK